jgi:Family of unknown function (DUF5681)
MRPCFEEQVAMPDSLKRKNVPTGDYEVGYCRPPATHRFRPGEVHNRRGRPRQPVTFHEALRKVLAEKITITIDGEAVQVTKAEAIGSVLLDKFPEATMASRLILKLQSEFDRELTQEQHPRIFGVAIMPREFERVYYAALKSERERDPDADYHEIGSRAWEIAERTTGTGPILQSEPLPVKRRRF